MSQMKINDRNRIEFLVALGWPLPRIAADLGRSPSTIRNEMLEHRLDSGKGFRCIAPTAQLYYTVSQRIDIGSLTRLE